MLLHISIFVNSIVTFLTFGFIIMVVLIQHLFFLCSRTKTEVFGAANKNLCNFKSGDIKIDSLHNMNKRGQMTMTVPHQNINS